MIKKLKYNRFLLNNFEGLSRTAVQPITSARAEFFHREAAAIYASKIGGGGFLKGRQ